MGIFDLYSKRKKRERGELPDVYQYENIPEALRIQIVHIWESSFGDGRHGGGAQGAYEIIHEILCREYGVFRLTERDTSNFSHLVDFMLRSSTPTEYVLDVVEITFRFIDNEVRKNGRDYYASQSPDDAIAELNARFREHGVGFQFESGKLLRVDSQIVHAEVVKPALQLLSDKHYVGANQEFLSAHEHYRHQKFKECLIDCLKAFESTIKCICAKRNWPHGPTDTAKPLLDVIFQRGLIPTFMQSHFHALRSTLEAGVPTVRNKLGGHGQGATAVVVPDHVAAYALHLTATNILFLVKAEKALK